MSRIEKTVFVSYRRTNLAWALAIFQDLTQHGYDVFFDFEGIASGNFERVILENIRARAHFLVLLTPSALDRCGDPEDWLRREIETALETRRNIVPLMLEGFDFSTPPIANRLTGKLAALKQYNALPVPAAYFGEAMGRLRDKFLNVPLEAVFHLASAPAQQAAAAQQVAASAAHAVGQRELTAEEWPAEARQRAEEERSRQEVEPKRRAKEEEAQKHAPLTPAEEAAPAQPAPAALPLIDRYRAEGRIKVDATIVHGAPEGWFLPGNGKAEWFKDHETGPEMVIVPAGKFMMGSRETEAERSDYESPQHQVTIARPFAIGRHAVTRGQFAAFVNKTGYKTEGGASVWTGKEWKYDSKASWRHPGFPQDDSHPVVCMSWEDAKAFAAWLCGQSGREYRLLSQAEWEYAARAGTTTPFWWGSTINPVQANYNGNYVYGDGAKGEFRKQTVAVGNFAPNPWGLYQVHGNVWEWCEDLWHETYIGAPSDGSAWLGGGDLDYRVVHGGSWNDVPGKLRSANRVGNVFLIRGYDVGFRVGRTPGLFNALDLTP